MVKLAFISGITGQDGSYLSELLVSKGYEVHGIVRRTSLMFSTDRLEHIKNKRVFFDTSNIFSYHISHACYTLDELIDSFNRLIDTLETHTEYYYLRGTNPLKKNVRITNV